MTPRKDVRAGLTLIPPPGWAEIELLPEEGAARHTGKRAWREGLR